jgi:TRAP-type mannitol/chloroaromatic compound transport system substrate-binding protein
MDRRDFIKQTSVAAVAAAVGTGASAAAHAASASVAAPAVGQGRRELRLAMPWLQNGRGFDDSARRLAASLNVLSSGQLSVKVLPGGSGLDALTHGNADAYHGNGRDFTALDPAFAFFAGMPGKAAMRPTYLNAWLTAAGGQSLWDDLSADHGFKPFFAGHAGGRAKLWSRTAIGSLDDVRGKRIAASGMSADIVARLGATATPLDISSTADALVSGRVDAVEGGATISGYACDLHTAARYCYAPGLSRSGFTSVLAIRTPVWNSLTGAQQALISAAVSQELNAVVAESLSVSHQLRLSLAERQGITFAPMPADVTAASLTAAAEAVSAVTSSSPRAARIYASYATFRASLPAKRRGTSAPPLA